MTFRSGSYFFGSLLVVVSPWYLTDAIDAPQSGTSPTEVVAPSFYESVIPRLLPYPTFLYRNLLYEGNNIIMRGREGLRSTESLGKHVSDHWRNLISHTRSTFVLRDALFSQQDHPVEFVPFALMLPANWITAAASHNGYIQPVMALPIHDDNSWIAFTTPEQLFGDFPPSDVLFRYATSQPMSAIDSSFVYHSRETITILARYAQQLIDARNTSVQAMIDKGANIIAECDRMYFGEDLRRKVTPIMVENPTRHEIEEGKGVFLNGDDASNEMAAAVRRAVYRRRLSDGDIAIERYDLSKSGERARAIHVLEELIPKGSSGATVWLWVTGQLMHDRTLQGEDATKYITEFRQEVRASNIEESRLQYVNKPSVQLKSGGKQSLDGFVNQFRELGLHVSVNLATDELKEVLESK